VKDRWWWVVVDRGLGNPWQRQPQLRQVPRKNEGGQAHRGRRERKEAKRGPMGNAREEGARKAVAIYTRRSVDKNQPTNTKGSRLSRGVRGTEKKNPGG